MAIIITLSHIFVVWYLIHVKRFANIFVLSVFILIAADIRSSANIICIISNRTPCINNSNSLQSPFELICTSLFVVHPKLSVRCVYAMLFAFLEHLFGNIFNLLTLWDVYPRDILYDPRNVNMIFALISLSCNHISYTGSQNNGTCQ